MSPNQFPDSPPPEVRVGQLQLDHKLRMESAGLLEKIRHNALSHGVREDKLRAITEGWPVVLSSESQGIRFLFVAFREPIAEEDDRSIRSYYVRIGAVDGGKIIPNFIENFDDTDCNLVEELYQEALHLKETVPHYSLESGYIAP